MRPLLFFLSAALMAQTTTTQHTAPSTRTSTVKRATSTAAKKPEPTLTTDEQKTIYALGLSIYRSLSPFNLSPAELDIVKRAMSDAAANKPAENLDTWGPKIQPLAQARATAQSQAYIQKAAAQPGAVTTASGLVFRNVTVGAGPSPQSTDTVTVNYRGTFMNGTEFDSSYKRNKPIDFQLNRVIKCWTEGVQMMKVGGKAQLVCPSDLAYGNQPPPGIPPDATLTFEIELLGINGAPQAAPQGLPQQ
ncbi:MAG TPA: FKBP-type peptidyl-prolyl cis-trans isomerase [Bryobacteraceae bacterium]|nr:FKBP-type peptidyl-prolyl cis-trans isomerase [Bryobacteraceae bacterium]